MGEGSHVKAEWREKSFWDKGLAETKLVSPLTDEEWVFVQELLQELTGDECAQLAEMPKDECKRMVEGTMNANKRAKHEKVLRILVARIKEHLRWHTANKLTNVLDWHLPPLRDFRSCFWPMKFCGTDSTGNAVVLIKFQECDFAKALSSVNTEDVLPCCMYTQACLRATIETLDLPFLTNYVIDFQSMGMKNYYQAYKLGLTSIFSMLSGHYPETVKTITLLHIPYFFNFCYNAVKQFIEPDTAEKITTFSASKGIVPFFKEKGIPMPTYPDESFDHVLFDTIIKLHEATDTKASKDSLLKGLKEKYTVQTS